jgi:DNA-binding response OmpR family regulator
LPALNGQEALDLFRQHAADIQLALLDVQMPEQEGPKLLSALRVVRPDLVCCFMSGSTGAYTEPELIELGAARVFHKPFAIIEVVGEVRQTMG